MQVNNIFMFTVIILESTENAWKNGIQREIRIASSAGNKELKNSDGDTISGRILSAGGLSISLNENHVQSTNRLSLPKRMSQQLWSDDYHVFELQWKSGLIVVKVDGIQYGEQVVDASFSKRVNLLYFS